MTWQSLLEPNDAIYAVRTQAPGPEGRLPLTPALLRDSPSGDVFGMTQNAGMGWPRANMLGPQVMIVSTAGGMRSEDGRPIALGLHSGHFELSDQVRAAAETIADAGGLPFATYVSDQCDGRSQGTTGMFDSLPYRNDAAIVMRRLIRSLPTRSAVMGVATCDKGLPATMMALASQHDLPTVLVPGGVTLPPAQGEDLARVQTLGVRYANDELSLEDAAELGCRACASPGGGCHFLGTAATSQVVAEALGLALPHSALAPSGEPVWAQVARQSAHAVLRQRELGITTRDVLTEQAVENAMAVHAAIGGSLNLLMHIPAIAHAAGLRRPTLDDWVRVNKAVPRIVSVLPNGPVHHPTVRMFLAGGTPEVMLHLRDLGLLHLDVLTATGETLGTVLDWWESSERRVRMKQVLLDQQGVEADDVIMSPARARERGLTPTATFPVGNLAPDGSVVKSTAIDPSRIRDGVFHHVGPARVFTSEAAAVAAIKERAVSPGDVMVMMGIGPTGTGMEETFQVTSALRYLSYGKEISLITDARFSGVSTGACVGHVGPEALAGGPIGRVRDGDLVEIRIDVANLEGTIDLVGDGSGRLTPTEGARLLAQRSPHPDLAPHPQLPADTRLWAALQEVSGGTWAGCVYDTDRIVAVLRAGLAALDGADG
ncbi:YjhG/YagF family D-xylonate dehydratase [Cellulomonas terrae]|uniref:YjhG/YagF family D-xylonate dehydratase n=1 Tax=Cellulomonas terrae TaxID=311234 RepID=UPI0011BD9EFF|nr:YjhG/YagF family D-xylonate dehydratase [Cellulomonas terrae]